MSSGLYEKLQEKQLFIAHEEFELGSTNFAKILKPTQLPFVSYAYEWSFSYNPDDINFS
jgi:hypothetical protein